MKTLPKNTTAADLEAMSMDEKMQFKNKFFGTIIGDKSITLRYFLNPYQSFSRHESQANKQIRKEAAGFREATLIRVDHTDIFTEYVYLVS